MINILDLNERVFQFLSGTNLTYTFRKSNYAGRLEQGYWFYGNEQYLAVSFWTGMDWKNRTPNIIFSVNFQGNIYLEINVSDSDRKKEFVTKFLVEPLQLGTNGRRFIKYYADNCSIEEAIVQLASFLHNDKRIIDQIIEEHASEFFLKNEEKFGIIDKKEFKERQSKLLKYRKDEPIDQISEARIGEKPHKLQSFKVRDFGPIHLLSIDDISFDNQWIFITGQNGAGKTSFLRAIATVLGYRALEKMEINRNPEFYAEARLYSNYHEQVEIFERNKNDDVRNRRPKVAGLCMYGPFRLINSRKLSTAKFSQLYAKAGSFASLFSDNSPLLDIDKQIDLWKKDDRSKHLLEKRQYYIKNILIEVVPNLYNIDFNLSEAGSAVTYQTRKNIDSVEYNTNWDDLSSGTRSVFSLILDILLRLYDQQPKVVDPSELKGIVIIDEIDLHLHPSAQKDLVVNLSNVFPGVQFIVTTHSPIPLLGAPRNSMIFVMSNDGDNVTIERMDDKVMFNKILPNAIFSSPIFGLEDLLPDSRSKNEIPYLEDDYNEIKRLENLQNDIDRFLTNEKQRELMNLFNPSKS